jgi:Zn-dependent metalloprotease
MTLKILKPKVSISLILNDEFLQYCKLNNIEDFEKLAIETFNRGFTILKYGETPSGIKIKEIVEKKIKKDPDVVKAVTETVIEIKKVDKNDIYAE